MPFPDDRGARWAQIASDWDISEKIIKQAELANDEAVFPAIKELRYAGRRLIDALNASARGQSDPVIDHLIDEARFNCHRARHDAIDAALNKIAIDLDDAGKRLGFEPILAVMPGYNILLDSVLAARELTTQARANRDDRDTLYTNLAEIQFDAIIRDYRLFKTSLPMIKEGSAKRRIGVAGGIIGWLVAAALAALAVPWDTLIG